MKDLLAILCSFTCIIHCLLTPVSLFIGMTGISMALPESEILHQITVIPIGILAVWSIFLNRQSNVQTIPVLLAILGLILLVISLIAGEVYEVYFTVSAGVLLIIAHLLNFKSNRKSQSQRSNSTQPVV